MSLSAFNTLANLLAVSSLFSIWKGITAILVTGKFKAIAVPYLSLINPLLLVKGKLLSNWSVASFDKDL